MNDSEIIRELRQASEGLLWMSESDYPFEVFYWQGLTKESLTRDRLLQQTNHSPNTPVELRQMSDFFQVALQEEDWHDARERETVKRYRNLVALLDRHLGSIEIYRVGMVEIDVYIVGQTRSGNLAGLSTKVIET